MQQTLSIALIIVALFATYTLPAKALNGNTCTVEYLSRGTYITQTAGKAGTINAYAGNAYKTTRYRDWEYRGICEGCSSSVSCDQKGNSRSRCGIIS